MGDALGDAGPLAACEVLVDAQEVQLRLGESCPSGLHKLVCLEQQSEFGLKRDGKGVLLAGRNPTSHLWS